MDTPDEFQTQPITVQIKTFGKRLEAYRVARGIRQEDLAQQAGLSRSTLHRMETGRGGTLDSLFRIMKALEISDRLLNLVPDASVSPLDPGSAREARRKRVRYPATRSGQYGKSGEWRWGE